MKLCGNQIVPEGFPVLLPAGKHSRARRLHGDHPDRRSFLLQISSHARNGAARADARHKKIHPSVRILPDLRPRGQIMGLRVGRIVKLTRNERTRDLLLQLLRLPDRPRHAFLSRRQDDIRPVGSQQLPAFFAHGFRHGQDHPVSPDGRDRRQADPRISAGGLDDRRSRLQASVRLRVQDHPERRPVLHASGGIQVFQLCQKPHAFDPRLSGIIFQLHQRRPPDQLRHIFPNLHPALLNSHYSSRIIMS